MYLKLLFAIGPNIKFNIHIFDIKYQDILLLLLFVDFLLNYKINALKFL